MIPRHTSRMRSALACMVMLLAGARTHAAGCDFSLDTLSFRGTAVEQARCLLRPVAKGGVLLAPLDPLPAPFAALIGTAVAVKKETLKTHITAAGLAPDALGGSLDAPLAHSASGTRPSARYFVIHDTSANVCVEHGQFAGSDAPTAPWNLRSRYANDPEAHLYITRDGKLIAPQ